MTAKRNTFISPMSWVNYDSSFGDVVDRFRWEGGCIVEHVSYKQLVMGAERFVLTQ